MNTLHQPTNGLAVISLFITLLTGMQVNAQLDYEDEVLPAVRNEPYHVSYPLLQEHQRINPRHANTYYQLGIIAHHWAKDYDPFTEFKDVNYFIYHTKVYFGLCKNYLDKKEARKHGEFYQGVQKSEGNWFHKPGDILPKIDSFIRDIKTYERHVKVLRRYYNRSVSHYHKSVNIFRDINGRYNSVKKLFMNAYDDFDAQAEALRMHFDSTLHYLTQYRDSLDAYPLKGYDQHYRLKDIVTYRLQGLTNTNFLQNDIDLWDYNSWLDTLYRVINHEISPLRTRIQKESARMDQHLDFVKKNPAPDSLLQYSIPRKLAYKIEKYDYQSLMLDYLKYRAAHLRFHAKLNQPENHREAYHIADDYSNYSRYFMEAVRKKLEADTLLNTFDGDINADDVHQYKQFFNARYGGVSEVRQFARTQGRKNRTALQKGFENLRHAMKRYTLKFRNDTASITYNNLPVHLQLVADSPLENWSDGYYPLAFEKREEAFYFTGYKVHNGEIDGAYAARMGKDTTLSWLLQLPAKTPREAGMAIDVGENLLYVLSGGYSKTDSLKQTRLFKLDQEGELIQASTLPYQQSPRYLIYDDINQNLLMAFKGKQLRNNTLSADTLLITRQSATLDSLHWEQRLQLNGNLVDVVRMDTTYLAFCNYGRYQKPRGGMVFGPPESGSTPGAAMALQIGINGGLHQLIDYAAKKPFFLQHAVKINSNRINLQGMQHAYYNLLSGEPAAPTPLYYALVNKKGRQVYRNTKSKE